MSLERITKVRLPFDRRDPDPTKNYGIHGFDIFFIVKGSKGAVQFLISVHAFLPHVERDTPSLRRHSEEKISGYDVGYHSKVPQFDGQTPMSRECDILGGTCYYDGSSLAADRWVKEIFSIRGEHPDEHMWKKLEAEYVERFGEES